MIDLDATLFIIEDKGGFSAVHGIFESVLEDNRQRDRLSEFMGALARSGGLRQTALLRRCRPSYQAAKPWER